MWIYPIYPIISLAQEPCLLSHSHCDSQFFQAIHNGLEKMSSTWSTYEFSVVWLLVDYIRSMWFRANLLSSIWNISLRYQRRRIEIEIIRMSIVQNKEMGMPISCCQAAQCSYGSLWTTFLNVHVLSKYPSLQMQSEWGKEAGSDFGN